MFKRILKIVSIVLAGFIVVAGAATGIYALTGGFKHESVPIIGIHFNEDTKNTVYVVEQPILEYQTFRVNYYPDNATSRVLDVIYPDDNIKNILDNPPDQILAGQDFTLRARKDSKGNNIGGYVQLKFKPAGEQKSLGECTLHLFVDVAIPNDSLYFTGDNNGKITASGKQFSMAMTGTKEGEEPKAQYIYLKSTLVNAFDLKNGDVNLKPVEIEYTYKDKYGVPINTDSWSKDFKIDRKLIDGENVAYYSIPVYPTVGGTIKISAKMHRTAQIAAVFNDDVNGFKNLIEIFENPTRYDISTRQNIAKNYSEFLYTYMKYFDTTADSYKFFSQHVNPSTGKILFHEQTDVSVFKESLKYVFVSAEATVNVVAVELKNLTSTTAVTEFDVTTGEADVKTYNIADLVKKFDIKMYTGGKDDDISSSTPVEYTDDNKNLYDSLTPTPYLYLSDEYLRSLSPEADYEPVSYDERTGKEYILWLGNRYEFRNVFGFTDENNVVPNFEENAELTGYLLKLENSSDFITVTQVHSASEPSWDISFNVPQVAETGKVAPRRALYLGFQVQGINLNTNEYIYKQSLSKVSIKYTGYSFIGNGEVSNLAFNEIKPYMTINTDLTPGAEDVGEQEFSKLASGLYQQELTLDNSILDSNVKPTYTNVLYFAEKTSNSEDGYKKIATVGTYKFMTYTTAIGSSAKFVSMGQEVLYGERIPTRTEDGKCNILALNASETPVKLFAVVYLSDKDGNPIDINGSKININEAKNTVDDAPTLIVIAMTNVDSSSADVSQVTIKSYVDNLYFYTDSQTSQTFGSDENGIVFDEGYIQRNTPQQGMYENLTDPEFKAMSNFLKLKLLKNYKLTLRVSNFELDKDGKKDAGDSVTELSDIKDIYGKFFSKEDSRFNINNDNNKQLALNAFAEQREAWKLDIQSSYISWEAKRLVSDDGVVEGFEYAITSTSNDSVSGEIKLAAYNSVIPYFEGLGIGNDLVEDNKPNNYVSYITTKLQIEDIQLDNTQIELKNELYGIYSSNGSNGEIDFGTIKDSVWKKYSIALQNGMFSFTYTTNLIDENNDVNLQYVDCSQANVGNENEGLEDGLLGGDFPSIYAYINFYLKQSTGISITPNNAIGGVKLASGAIFTNELDDETHIYMGDSKFKINEYDKVDINGHILNVKSNGDLRYIEIDENQIFPIVPDNSKNAEKKTIISIYGQEFEVVSDKGIDKIYRYTHLKDGSEVRGAEIKVITLSPEEYNPSDYLGDGTKILKYSADEATAYPAFKKGTEDGISVYLLLNFGFINAQGAGYEYNFTRVIEYVLKQESIELIGRNEDNSINSDKNKLLIDAGETTTILLDFGSGNAKSICVTNSIQTNFFKHVTVKHSRINNFEARYAEDDYGTDPRIEINVGNFIEETSAVITLEYSEYGKIKTFEYHVIIIPNLNFKLKNKEEDWAQILEDNNIEKLEEISLGEYEFNVKSGTEINGFDKAWLENFFEISGDITGISLDISTGGDYYKNKKIEYKFGSAEGLIQFEPMKITVNGQQQTTNTIIKIKIIPEYSTSISGATVFEDTSLYNNVIKLYTLDEEGNKQLVPNASDKCFEGLEFKIIDSQYLEDGNSVVIEDGKIGLAYTQLASVSVKLEITYNQKVLTVDGGVTVVIQGIGIYYSEIGDVDNNDVEKQLTPTNNTITIAVEKGSLQATEGKFNIDGYIRAIYMGSGSGIDNTKVNAFADNKYYIYYTVSKTGEQDLEICTGYTLKVVEFEIKEDKYYSIYGDMNKKEEWDGNSLTLYIPNKEFIVDNYLSVSAQTVDATPKSLDVKVVLIDKNELYNDSDGYLWLDSISKLTIGKDGKEYAIGYKVVDVVNDQEIEYYICTNKTLTLVAEDVEIKYDDDGHVNTQGVALRTNLIIEVATGDFDLNDYLSIAYKGNVAGTTVELVLLDNEYNVVATPTTLDVREFPYKYKIGYKVNNQLISDSLIVNVYPL